MHFAYVSSSALCQSLGFVLCQSLGFVLYVETT